MEIGILLQYIEHLIQSYRSRDKESEKLQDQKVTFFLNYARVKAHPRSNHIPKFFQSVWHQRPSREEMYIKEKKQQNA